MGNAYATLGMLFKLIKIKEKWTKTYTVVPISCGFTFCGCSYPRSTVVHLSPETDDPPSDKSSEGH